VRMVSVCASLVPALQTTLQSPVFMTSDKLFVYERVRL
jgi:hypothetical protein